MKSAESLWLSEILTKVFIIFLEILMILTRKFGVSTAYAREADSDHTDDMIKDRTTWRTASHRFLLSLRGTLHRGSHQTADDIDGQWKHYGVVLFRADRVERLKQEQMRVSSVATTNNNSLLHSYKNIFA